MRYEAYQGPSGPEWMILHGPDEGVRVLILAPLFGEANGTRALLVDMARRLAAAGVGSAIPDMPGTGESVQPLPIIGWHHWRAAAAAAGRHLGIPHAASLRGGALLDDAVTVRSRWRFAPAAGAVLLRQLERAQMITDREVGAAAPAENTIALAGYQIAPQLCDQLRKAEPAEVTGPLHILPFEGPGVAPWRRAEPAGDPMLAARLADDLLAWIRTCDA